MGRYDVVVIGAGPGGEGAAMTAAKAGKSVAVIDRYEEIGGGCVHWGTIPSKALRQAIWQLHQFRDSPIFSRHMDEIDITFPDMLRTATSVVATTTAAADSAVHPPVNTASWRNTACSSAST